MAAAAKKKIFSNQRKAELKLSGLGGGCQIIQTCNQTPSRHHLPAILRQYLEESQLGRLVQKLQLCCCQGPSVRGSGTGG